MHSIRKTTKSKRVNRLAATFQALSSYVLEQCAVRNRSEVIRVVDSMPVITCSGKRTPKVAREIVDKSYCASKALYYHGVKLHLLASQVKGTMPYPQSIIITPASESDPIVYHFRLLDQLARQVEMLAQNSRPLLNGERYPSSV